MMVLPTPDDRLLAEMVRELEPHPNMEITLQPVSVMQLAGLLQLALRHPHLDPTNRATAERFLAAARDYFAECPAVLEVLRRGDDPAEDM
jgi:hypothetical protein